jgi:hypothetical protein
MEDRAGLILAGVFADGLLDVCTWMDFSSDDDHGEDLL